MWLLFEIGGPASYTWARIAKRACVAPSCLVSCQPLSPLRPIGARRPAVFLMAPFRSSQPRRAWRICSLSPMYSVALTRLRPCAKSGSIAKL